MTRPFCSMTSTPSLASRTATVLVRSIRLLHSSEAVQIFRGTSLGQHVLSRPRLLTRSIIARSMRAMSVHLSDALPFSSRFSSTPAVAGVDGRRRPVSCCAPFDIVFSDCFPPLTKLSSEWLAFLDQGLHEDRPLQGRSLAWTTTPVETIIESSDGTEFGRYHCWHPSGLTIRSDLTANSRRRNHHRTPALRHPHARSPL